MKRRKYKKARDALKRRITLASRSSSEIDKNWLNRIYMPMISGDLKPHRSKQHRWDR